MVSVKIFLKDKTSPITIDGLTAINIVAGQGQKTKVEDFQTVALNHSSAYTFVAGKAVLAFHGEEINYLEFSLD